MTHNEFFSQLRSIQVKFFPDKFGEMEDGDKDNGFPEQSIPALF